MLLLQRKLQSEKTSRQNDEHHIKKLAKRNECTTRYPTRWREIEKYNSQMFQRRMQEVCAQLRCMPQTYGYAQSIFGVQAAAKQVSQ
jgi:hypothetical protein